VNTLVAISLVTLAAVHHYDVYMWRDVFYSYELLQWASEVQFSDGLYAEVLLQRA
jgi:hypothetical protein